MSSVGIEPVPGLIVGSVGLGGVVAEPVPVGGVGVVALPVPVPVGGVGVVALPLPQVLWSGAMAVG